jgi:spoIIIJ-associated protein
MAHEGEVFEGKTLDAAVRSGLDALGLTRAEVMITILEEGSGGFLGIGARPYRVRVMRRPGGPPPTEPDVEGRRRRHEGRDRRERGRGERRGERGGQGGSRPEPGRGPRREERDGLRRRDERGEPRAAQGRGERRRDERRPQAGQPFESGRTPERGERREDRRETPRLEHREERRGERPAERHDERREERPAPLESRPPEFPAAEPEGAPGEGRRRRRRGRRGGRRRHGAPGEVGHEAPFAPEASATGPAGFAAGPPEPEADEEVVDRYEDLPEGYEEPVEPFEDLPAPDEESAPAAREPEHALEREPRERPSEREPRRPYEREPGERPSEREPRRSYEREPGERPSEREPRRSYEREPREPRVYEGPGLSADELAAHGRRVTEELLKAMGFEATVGATADGNHVEVTAEVAKDEDLLTGRKGEVRQALQHLLNRVLNRGESSRYHLQLEINDFWKRREEELRELARSLADEAASSGGEVITEYLNAQERRIVHVTLREDSRVKTYALGTGMIKRVAIAPADFESGPRDE